MGSRLSDHSTRMLIADLYDGVIEDAAWNRAIRGITDVVSGASSIVFGIDALRQEVVRAELHGIEREVHNEFATRWAEKEVRLPHVLRCPATEAMFDKKLLSLREWKKSEIYNEFLVRIDRPWILSFWLHKSSEKCTLLTIHGSVRRGPMDASDAELLQPLVEHLRRAQRIRGRLEEANLCRGALERSWDHVTFGVVILDARGKVLAENSTADALMRTTPGVRRCGNRSLSIREPAGSQLAACLAAGSRAGGRTAALLHVPRAGRRAISIVVTRLRQQDRAWLGGDPRWVLFLLDPERKIQTHGEQIARDLGLSEREAELTALLVAGYNLNRIAARLGISVHTVRAHLKNIFIKTGVRSQIELVRSVCLGPFMFGGTRNERE